MNLYADSNVWVRWYLDFDDSTCSDTTIAKILSRQKKPIPVFWLHRYEVANAMMACVFAARSGGFRNASIEGALMARGQFLADFESGEGVMAENPVPIFRLWSVFDDLSLRHTAARGYRTYDLLHVSAALLLECDTFWSFDAKACELARREGLKLI